MPSNKKTRRLGALVFMLLLGTLPDLASAERVPPSKQSLQELRERIESLKKDLDSTREAHSEAADALKKSERAISDSKRRLHLINEQQETNRETLQQAQQEKSRLEDTIANQREQLAGQLYQQYLHGQPSYLQIVLTQRDPNVMAREVQYFGYLARARAQQISSLRTNLDSVTALNQRTSATLEEIDALKSEQEQVRQQLESEKSERQKVLKSLSQKIKSQRGEISKLQRDQKRLTELVERLSRIVPAKPKRKSQQIVRKNESIPTADLRADSFAALKGKLHLPVPGDILNQYGAAREDSGVSWKGLFIRAAEGAQVKSIAAGTVVFADWLRGFGNLLIVNHGDGYMSLYGNNQALLKQVGDEVKSGDDIATVGNSGGNADNGVYFEMRHQSKPFDPLSWCVIR